MGRMNISQLKSKLNQARNKRKAALRKIEQGLKTIVNNHNQRVRQHNQKVRQHNVQVRASKQKLISALNTFIRHSNNPNDRIIYSTEYTRSVKVLNNSYSHLEARYDNQENGIDQRLILDLPERENTNNLMLYNSLGGNDEDDGQVETDLQRTFIEELLHQIKPEYCQKWQGAIYALDPRNVEAARHFCSSAREVCIGILNTYAPDEEVRLFPGCEYTQDINPKPTRRSKINYLLYQKSITNDLLTTFVEDDLDSMLRLFHELNSGTHGSVGRFEIPQLLKLKNRSEDYIKFIAYIAS